MIRPAVDPAPVDRPVSLRAGVASGIRWGVVNQAVQQVARLVVQLVLTRLLAPSAFGLLALSYVVVNFGALLSGVGFSQALVQRERLEDDLVDAAFVGSAMLGAGLAAVVLAAATPLASMLGDAEVAPILRVLGLVFVFQGVEGVPNGMLRRHLRFRPFVLSSTIATVVGAAVGVAMAARGAGVWSLVGFAMSEAVLAATLAWVFAIRAGVWRPRVTRHLRPLRDVLGYSSAVTSNRMLSYGSRNVDNVIVGRVLGAAALGHYNLAYRVMLFPIQRATDVVASVSLPAFARVQGDPERLRSGYLRAVRLLAALIVPVTVGVAVTADHLVPVVFGAQWTPAVVPLQVLACSGPALALMRLNGNLWEATGQAGLSLAMSAVGLGLLVPAFLVGVRYGVVGVATAYTATAYVGLLPAVVVLWRSSGIAPARQLGNLVPVVAATFVMVLAALGARELLPHDTGDGLQLAGMVVAGAVVYLAALWLVDRHTIRQALADLRSG